MTSKDAEIFTDSWRWRRRWSPRGSCDQLQLMVGQQSVNTFKRLTQVIVECKAEDQTFAQCWFLMVVIGCHWFVGIYWGERECIVLYCDSQWVIFNTLSPCHSRLQLITVSCNTETTCDTGRCILNPHATLPLTPQLLCPGCNYLGGTMFTGMVGMEFKSQLCEGRMCWIAGCWVTMIIR